uniref:Uncharacterized protein n=1 Tax=Ditylenchus dipsaci TaxID=166011 RepID=A0A915DKR9_9BILA
MRERYERQTSLQNINEFDNYSEEAAGKIQRPRTTQTIEFLTSTPPAELSVFALSHNSLTKSSEHKTSSDPPHPVKQYPLHSIFVKKKIY